MRDESAEEDFPQCHITALNQVSSKAGQPFLVDIELDAKPIQMEVDIGACMSLILPAVLSREDPEVVTGSLDNVLWTAHSSTR